MSEPLTGRDLRGLADLASDANQGALSMQLHDLAREQEAEEEERKACGSQVATSGS